MRCPRVQTQLHICVHEARFQDQHLYGEGGKVNLNGAEGQAGL